MNTGNAAGYLVGAILAAPCGKRLGDKRVFAINLLLTALTIGASGFTANLMALLVLRWAAARRCRCGASARTEGSIVKSAFNMSSFLPRSYP
jgi:MFS family permease